MKKYNLINVAKIHKEHPTTFEIPSVEEISNIAVDDFCKLVFDSYRPFGATPNIDCERMWVKVKSVDPDNKTFVGTLANDPVVLEDELMFGDLISFNDYHVAGIIKDEYI